jgi:hypothetical protein
LTGGGCLDTLSVGFVGLVFVGEAVVVGSSVGVSKVVGRSVSGGWLWSSCGGLGLGLVVTGVDSGVWSCVLGRGVSGGPGSGVVVVVGATKTVVVVTTGGGSAAGELLGAVRSAIDGVVVVVMVRRRTVVRLAFMGTPYGLSRPVCGVHR